MKQLVRFLKRKTVRQILGDDFALSEKQTRRLLLILDTSKKVKQLEDWLPAMAYFVQNDLTNYVGRLRRLQKLPASPNLYNLVLRYGKVEALRRYVMYNERRTVHFSNKLSYWTAKGFTIEQAQAEIGRIQTDRSKLSAQVLRGTSEYSIRSIVYWLKQGLTLDEARAQVKRVQTTNGLEAYRRRGCETPEHAQAMRNEKWFATMLAKSDDERRRIRLARNHTIEGCMARGLSYDVAEKVSAEYFSKRTKYSQISQTCFSMVCDCLGPKGLYYRELNYEKQFNGKNVDFFDQQSAIAIEFYGDFWHANPCVYDSKILIYGKPACFVWQDDKTRVRRIADHSSINQIYIIWESEFRENPTEVVSFVIELLEEARKWNLKQEW